MPRHNMAPQKAKNFKASIKTLARNLKGSYLFLIFALIFAVASAVMAIISPNVVKELTNTITAGVPRLENGMLINTTTKINMQELERLALIVGGLYVASFVFSYLQGLLMANTTQKLSKQLRNNISTKINRLPFKSIDGTTKGDVLSRVTNDVDTISSSLSNSLTPLVSGIIMVVGSVIMMFVTNWIMALSAIGASIIGAGLSGLIMSKSQKFFVAQQKGLGELNGHIEEAYSGHNVVAVSNAKTEFKQNFDNLNNALYKSAWKAQFLSGLMMPIMGFIGNLGYVVVCVVGAMLTISGKIEFGVIIAFIIYVRLFSSQLSQIAQSATSMQQTAAASERVFEFLGEEELSADPLNPQAIDKVLGNVEFNHINFSYDPAKPIINDFTASVKAGQKVAIVGKTGAGKTTLVNLLMRFYEVQNGAITIDGVDIKDMTRAYLHNLFGMVLQDTWLFEGTIYENIIFNQKDVTQEQVEEACRNCGLHHFIMTLPKGYNTILDDNTSISAGQKQLLTIARAMVQNAPMLILDEATSSVDTRTEQLISDAMDKLTDGRTSFVIAHRLSTIKNADLILVMQNGDIVERGTHDELLANPESVYAKLYNSQFEE